MSLVTIIWAMNASACLTFALMYVFIWCRRRDVLANLLFAVIATGAAFVAGCELAMMRAGTPMEFGWALRWGHLAISFDIIFIAWFVRLFLQAGRTWLAWLACILRTLSMIPNFMPGENLNYREILRLRHVRMFGESVSVAEGVSNPWMLLSQIGLLLLVIFVADAAITVWQLGDRRRAITVGGSIAFLLLAGALEVAAVAWGLVTWPITVSLFYLGFVLAMGYELSRDALRAAQLIGELRESEHRMTQAAEAANVGIWFWDLSRDEIWANDQWRELFGMPKLERLGLDFFLQRVHPDDRDALRQSLTRARQSHGGFEAECRVLLAESILRWIALRGGVELSAEGKPVGMRGVALDITHLKQLELERQTQRNELTHLLRVASLGELSAALAHELNQPLTAILSNAQAANRLLAQAECDPTEIREILTDIVADNHRASEVIRRLRTLVKKGDFQPQTVEVNALVEDVLKLMNGDLAARAVFVQADLAIGLPPVFGDRVQLQQVLINLVLNAEEAMSQSTAGGRTLTLESTRSEPGMIRISVTDTGGGIPPGDEEKIFQAYYTTKAEGLGLGLSLSRSILVAHGGQLSASNKSGRGARFDLTLPEWKEHQYAQAATAGDGISGR